MKKIMIALLLFQTTSFAQIPQTGYYSGVVVVRNETEKTIAGYFSATVDAFTCLYGFKGSYKTVSDKTIDIRTIWPDGAKDISGTLTCAKSRFTIKLEQPLPGDQACAGATQTGLDLQLTTAQKWIGIAAVRSQKTYFYDSRQESSKRRAYLLKNDGVGVVSESEGWLYVDFYNDKNRLTSGWVKKNDFYRL